MENVKKVFKWVVLLLVFVVVVLALVPKYEPKYDVKNEPIDTNSTEYKEQYAIAVAKHEKSMKKEHLGETKRDAIKRAKAQKVQDAKDSKALLTVESHLKIIRLNLVSVDFSINNKSQGVVTDLEVKCSHYSPTYALLGTNRKVLYVRVPKASVKKVNDFVMGRVDPQANKGSCKVLSYMLDGVRVWY